MYWHTSDHAKQDGRKPGVLAHRGFWLHDVPRLMLWCRLRGHRPVVDGYGPHKRGLDARRWVACARCGVRPDPQGDLDPAAWVVGQRYDGPFLEGSEPFVFTTELVREAGGRGTTSHALPGPWTANPTGTLGGELLVGKTFGVFSAEVKVGNAGSDHTLAAHLRIWPLGALYLHTERFGTWLQRRLIPTGYESRVIRLDLGDWRLRWKVWAKRDSWSRGTPRWQDGSLNLDLVERLFGPKRYSYEDTAGPEFAWVRLPEGDEYQVRLRLQRQRLGRPKSRRPVMSWSVEWESDRPIPVQHRNDGKSGGITAASVKVADDAATNGWWVTDACIRIGASIAEQRTRYGYQPETTEESSQ